MNEQKGVLVVVSGFSGAGKGTLMKELLARYDNYALSISMTTRKPRQGEVDGVHYFFVEEEKFKDTIQAEGLLEYANYCGNYYGTPKAYVEKCLEEGKDVILEIEIQGALKIKEMLPDTVLLFVTTPSAAVLHDRLAGRGTETPEQVAGRLERAREEALGIEAYDYIVINDDLEACTKRIHAIVQGSHGAEPQTQYQAVHSLPLIEQIREELSFYAKGDTP